MVTYKSFLAGLMNWVESYEHCTVLRGVRYLMSHVCFKFVYLRFAGFISSFHLFQSAGQDVKIAYWPSAYRKRVVSMNQIIKSNLD